MGITVRNFGTTPDGRQIHIYRLTNRAGTSAEIATVGGAIVTLHVPDRNGRLDDVTLGFDNGADYVRNGPYLGALVGRHANRIEDAVFELNGVEYNLAKNDGNNHLHGGLTGFNKAVWEAEIVEAEQGEALQLKYRSVDMEEGYPGNLDVKVTYALTDEHALIIDYEAVSDRDTVINLTNHAYFNLAGHASGTIENHELAIDADRFTPVNDECIPTGEIRDVAGTPMDFRTPKRIGPGLSSDDEQIKNGGGYDHNWVLKVNGARPEKFAELYEPGSGRVMEVFTTKPGVQFYSGNFLDGSETGKDGAVYGKRSGLCLETQFFPNAMKHKHFPSPILRAGELYKHTTIYKFGVK
ncbi:aldose epimerase family protein [Paenibacillus thermotolerans]|uniref:aldose epimerase family protein n=1 Tax=Paenibacillus thermotolerans TaxID=3027807 RepID=UPI002367610E|nr:MULTISPECIES: aldose epimerase family protein [unclassified Paenibacillus]